MNTKNIASSLRRTKREILGILPLKPTYHNLRQAFANSNDQFPNVEWLSHHIPKTAGMSLKHSFRQAFGPNHFQEAYSDTYLPKKLSKGKSVWVPKSIKVIHGHFRPHAHHIEQFPNARRIIWIRDPVERNISLLSHVLTHPMIQSRFVKFKTKYTLKEYSFPDLLTIMLNDDSLYSATRIYKYYLNGFKKSDFAFLGRVDHYNEDLVRLQGIMGVKLTEYLENVKTVTPVSHVDTNAIRIKLQSEYDLLEEWI